MESMGRASRARASATRGTPEQCAKMWTATLVMRLIVDNMANVLKGVVSAQTDTRGPGAIKPPNRVVQETAAPAALAAAPRAPPAPQAAAPAATAAAGATTIAQVGTAIAIDRESVLVMTTTEVCHTDEPRRVGVCTVIPLLLVTR